MALAHAPCQTHSGSRREQNLHLMIFGDGRRELRAVCTVLGAQQTHTNKYPRSSHLSNRVGRAPEDLRCSLFSAIYEHVCNPYTVYHIHHHHDHHHSALMDPPTTHQISADGWKKRPDTAERRSLIGSPSLPSSYGPPGDQAGVSPNVIHDHDRRRNSLKLRFWQCFIWVVLLASVALPLFLFFSLFPHRKPSVSRIPVLLKRFYSS